jgi:hypothetical protein
VLAIGFYWTMEVARFERLFLSLRAVAIDPATADHVVDAVDQQIEVAVARVEQLISVAEETSEPLGTQAQAVIVEKLQSATEQIEQAVERVDTIAPPAENALGTSGPTLGLALTEPSQATAIATPTETPGPVQRAEPEAVVDNLDQATQRFKEAVRDVETLVVAAQEESRRAHPRQAIRPERD